MEERRATLAVMARTDRWMMEAVLAVLAVLVFLGFLGSIDLWGKREQRAAAEAIDTIDNDRWLVARIQDRPRLEKPPLPRWTTAVLMRLSGRRDQWILRLPGALCALATVGLVYGIGCRLGGRAVGLAAGLALTSMPFFICELRQAGNDGPLAFFTTLALYAAWRRLHGAGALVPGSGLAEPEMSGSQPGGRHWALLMYVALGLGCLTKGPIIVLLVALTVVPYLVSSGRLRQGIGLLVDGWGFFLFLALALSWPLPVLVNDSNVARVWLLEMGQKAGTAGIPHKHAHPILAAAWPWMTVPWVVVASTAIALPFLPRGRGYAPAIWFPWWWAVGNLAMFSFWPVAKPNYFLPCLPGAALLVGIEWVRLTRAARAVAALPSTARKILQFHWAVLVAGGLTLQVLAAVVVPQYLGWSVLFAAIVVVAVLISVRAWRGGGDAGALAPLSGIVAAAALIAFGAIAPDYNTRYSHRDLAAALERVVPSDSPTIMFFDEVDEGLWFYLKDRALIAVPESQPRYNSAFARDEDQRNNRLELDPSKRLRRKTEILSLWLGRRDRESSYLLMRQTLYEQMKPVIDHQVVPIHGEEGLGRYAMILLRVNDPGAVVARGESAPVPVR